MQIQCHQIELLAIVKTYWKLKGILRGQPISVYWPQTKNLILIQDVLSLTSDWMYQSRLQLEKYGPRLSISKAYTIPLQVQSHSVSMTPASIKQQRATLKVNKNLKCSQRQNWMTVSKQWYKQKVDTNEHEDLNLVLQITKRGQHIPSYYNRDSNSTNERSTLKDLL